MSADPALFPRDRALFEPQMRLWVGDSLLGGVAAAGAGLPVVFAAMHLAGLAVLFAAAVALGRRLGADWPTVGAFLALLTLKHQITRTGANSLEGYGHPRMLAFALGMAALAGLVGRRRLAGTAVALGLAAAVHTTTALWFGVLVGVVVLWDAPRRVAVAVASGGLAAALLVVLLVDRIRSRLVTMDETWITAIGDRSYLFSADWPASAWVVNLAYPIVIGLLYRRRRALGVTVGGEAGVVAGLFALVALFLVSVPFTADRLALAVQLQVNRIFWLLDAVTAFYLAWWLVSDLGREWRVLTRWAVAGAFVVLSAVRGGYLLTVAPARPAAQVDLPSSPWTDAMRWLRTQPASWHVLADPGHVWRFGSSVRVAALRDTLLEAGKDPALAIYDREAARRVLERSEALVGFGSFTAADVRRVAARYDLDVFVDEADRRFEFPILYRNDRFVVYDLR
jgi:hypothetical protein